MKRFFICFFTLFLLISCVFADYIEGELPVWAVNSDTAYGLQGGEWSIDFSGPVTYGIIDGLQVGTYFWVWFAQIPSIYAKWNFIQETDSLPALAIGGKFLQAVVENASTTSKLTTQYFNISGYVSKKVSENLYLTGSYTYNKFNFSTSSSDFDNFVLKALKDITGQDDPTSISNITASLIYQMSKSTRFMIEGGANIYDKSYYYGSPGFEWALGDMFRLKLSVLTIFGNTNFYWPYLNMRLRFK